MHTVVNINRSKNNSKLNNSYAKETIVVFFYKETKGIFIYGIDSD